MPYQLDFFQAEISEIDEVKKEVKGVKESNEKVRKSMFARHGELARKYTELHERLQILERHICQGSSANMSLQS